MTRTKKFLQLDGARYLGESGASEDFWINATVNPSFVFRNVGNSYTLHHFLRFNVEFPSEFVTVKKASLTLYWAPNKHFPINHIKRSAFVRGEGHILVSVIDKTTTITNASTARTQQALAFDFDWKDVSISLKNRYFSIPINTTSFHTALNSLISAKGSTFTEIYIFLCPTNHSKKEDVGWSFKSKESIRHIAGKTFEIPKLTITYSYDPILPDADQTLDQTMDMSCQFDLVGFDFTLDQSLPHFQEFDFTPDYQFTLTQSQNLIQDFTFLYDQTLEQSITPVQNFTILKDFTLDQTLIITQFFEDYQFTLDQSIDLTQSFTINHFVLDQFIDIRQEFNLETSLNTFILDQTITHIQEFSLNFELNFTIDQTMSMDQFFFVTARKSSGAVIPIYSSEDCDITLINDSPTQITLIPINTLRLDFPYDGPPFSHTVILRNPEFGNVEEFTKQRIQRETIGGRLIVYADLFWDNRQIFKMGFESLQDSVRANIINFIDVSLGKRILLTDHESREWQGIILNPNGEILKTNTLCGNTFEFEFLVLGPTPGTI